MNTLTNTDWLPRVGGRQVVYPNLEKNGLFFDHEACFMASADEVKEAIQATNKIIDDLRKVEGVLASINADVHRYLLGIYPGAALEHANYLKNKLEFVLRHFEAEAFYNQHKDTIEQMQAANASVASISDTTADSTQNVINGSDISGELSNSETSSTSVDTLEPVGMMNTGSSPNEVSSENKDTLEPTDLKQHSSNQLESGLEASTPAQSTGSTLHTQEGSLSSSEDTDEEATEPKPGRGGPGKQTRRALQSRQPAHHDDKEDDEEDNTASTGSI